MQPPKRVLVNTPGLLAECEAAARRHLKRTGSLDLALDVETTGLDTATCSITGVSLCWSPALAAYIDTRALPDAPAGTLHSVVCLATTLVGHNVFGFDGPVLERYGCPILGNNPLELHDTMIAAYATGQWAEEMGSKTRPLGLKTLSRRVLEYQQGSLQDLFAAVLPEHTGSYDFSLLPVHDPRVLQYVTDDAWCTWLLAEQLLPFLAEHPGRQLVYDLERTLAGISRQIEQVGILIDRQYLALNAERLRNARAVLDAWLRAAYDLPAQFNFDSSRDMQILLYERLGLPILERSKPSTRFPNGQPKTDEHTIEQLIHRGVTQECQDWLRNYQVFRGVQKAINQYFDGLPDHIQADGAIRTHYRQFGTATGRYSSADPNLQNISRKENWELHGSLRGTRVQTNTRRCFVARPGYYFLDSDYAAIEARIMASASQDPAYLEVFRSGQDPHYMTAAQMFETPVDQVTKEQRARAKTVVYGWGFGQQVEQMAKRNHMPEAVMQAVHDRFVDTYRELVRWRTQVIAAWYDQHGWAFTYVGRARYLPQYESHKKWIRRRGERAAFNHFVQGTAADVQKMALIRIARMLQQEYGPRTGPGERPTAQIIMHTHDSNVIEVHNSVPPEELTPKVHKCMRIFIRDDWLPFVVDSHVCQSLG